MTDASPAAHSRPLPPSFDPARTLSGLLAYFFLLNFRVKAIWLAAALAIAEARRIAAENAGILS